MGEVKAGDLAQYVASLAFRLGCRAGVGENIAIGEPFRAELERALTEAASLLRSQAEEIARLREAVEEAQPLLTRYVLDRAQTVLGREE